MKVIASYTWAIYEGQQNSSFASEFMDNPKVVAAGEPLKPAKELLWTDQFTALWDIMK